MKKIDLKGALCACVLIFGCATLFAGGSKDVKNAGKKAEGKTLSVVCTIFPEYDWVKQIVGDVDSVELTMLLDNGVDLHSYQPSASDIVKIATCDVFVYVGGESDFWVEDALKEAVNKNMVVVDLLDVLGESVKEEEVVEGMQGEEEEHEHGEGDEHAHEEGAEHEHEEGEIEYDEHVWLSVKAAITLTNHLAAKLAEVDATNAASYKANANTYTAKLASLDKEYADAVASSKHATVLFGDRFPFRYLVDDYGISYYAAFVGCSAETEASFETIAFLSKKVDELGLDNVLIIENSDGKIAKTIIQNTKNKNQNVLVMNSLQSVTSRDVASGADYYSIMKDNLEVLKKALN